MQTKHRDPICQECNGRLKFESIGRVRRADRTERTYEIYRCEDCDLLTDAEGEPLTPR